MKARFVWTTVPKKSASEMAREAVEERLAACASVFPVHSTFRWRGKIDEEDELLMLFKTTHLKARKLRSFLEKKHPYEVPEIVEFEPKHISQIYLSWIEVSVAG